jgi:hypothetical protein
MLICRGRGKGKEGATDQGRQECLKGWERRSYNGRARSYRTQIIAPARRTKQVVHIKIKSESRRSAIIHALARLHVSGCHELNMSAERRCLSSHEVASATCRRRPNSDVARRLVLISNMSVVSTMCIYSPSPLQAAVYPNTPSSSACPSIATRPSTLQSNGTPSHFQPYRHHPLLSTEQSSSATRNEC